MVRLWSRFENPPTKPDTSGKKKKGTLTHRQIGLKYRPFAGDIGQIVISWGRLQETLARLFWFVTGVDNGAIPLAIWQSIPSDRTQRDMLAEVAQVAFSESIFRKARMPDAPSNKRALDDILWIIEKVEALASKRNNTIHSPFVVILAEEGDSLASNEMLGNRAAFNLRGKDLRAEFKWYRDRSETLIPFVHEVATRVRWPDSGPWPDKPELPQTPHAKRPKAKRRKKIPK